MIVLFWIGIVISTVLPLYLQIIVQDTNSSWLSLIIGIFLVLISRFDNIIEITLGPLKAKLKEKVDEATVNAEQLRNITSTTSKLALTQLMASNFMGGFTLKEKISLHDELLKQLENLGFGKQEILDIDGSWRNGIGVIYHSMIHTKLLKREKMNTVNPDITDEERRVGEEFQKLLIFKTWSAPHPDLMETFINDKNMMNEEIMGFIEDYRYFLKTNELRNLEKMLEIREK